MTNGDDARAPGTSGYAEVNDLEMYYEIHGSGPPLVLLHGAFSAIGTSFGASAGSCRDSAGHRLRAAGPWAHGRHRSPALHRAIGR